MEGISSTELFNKFPVLSKILKERDEHLRDMLPDIFKSWMDNGEAPSLNYGKYYISPTKSKNSKKISTENENNNNNNNPSKMLEFIQAGNVQPEIWKNEKVIELRKIAEKTNSNEDRFKLVRLVYSLQVAHDGNDPLESKVEKTSINGSKDLCTTLCKFIKFVLTMESPIKLEKLEQNVFYSIPRLKGFKIFLTLMPYSANTRHNQLKNFSIVLRAFKGFQTTPEESAKIETAYQYELFSFFYF
jgi:nucleoside diphosphate kinase